MTVRSPIGAPVLVYDPNTVNPYGAELACLLTDHGVEVVRFGSRDSRWNPTQTRAVLPASGTPRHVVAQAVDQLLGPLRAVVSARRRRAVIVVTWTRGWWEEWVFGLVARRHPVVFVHHNPNGRERLSRPRAHARSTLLTTALPVVHTAGLITHLSARDQGHHRVVPHLPYVKWREWVLPQVHQSRSDGALRLLLLGTARDDKGLADLGDLLAPVLRDQVRLVIAGKGSVASWVGSGFQSLHSGYVEDRTSENFLSPSEFAGCLVDGGVLLAPYTEATQSGTVAMALTWGLGVIAYSSGGLAELLTARSLVPVGDIAAFQRLLEEYLSGPWACGAQPIGTWRAAATRGWLRVLQEADTRQQIRDRPAPRQALAR